MRDLSPVTSSHRPTQRNRPKPGGVLGLIFAAWLVLGVTGVPMQAQEPLQVAKAQVILAANGAHPESAIKAAVVVRIAAGYHINAHHPSLNYLIPTEVRFSPLARAKVLKVIYPAGRAVHFSFSKTPLSVYEGEVPIGLMVKVGRTGRASEIILHGQLSYQACNDHACFAPTSIPLVVTVPVLPPNVPLKPAHSAIFSRLRFN